MKHLDVIARWVLSICLIAAALGFFIWLLQIPGISWHRFRDALPYLALAVVGSLLWLSRPGS